MKKDKKDMRKGPRRKTFSLAIAFACMLTMMLGLAGCGMFDGGKAEVKVDFGQYGDTGSGSSATEPDAGKESMENNGTQPGAGNEGETQAPGAGEGASQAGGDTGQSGSESKPDGWPGKDDDESGTGSSAELQAPAEHRDAFNKSEFSAELLAYLTANGRGEEAFSEPIFDSEKKVYSKEELEKLSDVMCKIFRNEIYARHGMIFGDEDLNQLYGAFSWYKGTIGLREFEAQAELPFNETEYANISNVVAVEKARREQNGN